jgi:lipopolysaccharide export system permease protein
VIVADSGRMEFEGDRYLLLTLFNGNSYEQKDNRSRDELTYPHMRNSFVKEVIRFDMSEFSMRRSNEEIFKDNYKMQSLGQLTENIDTLKRSLIERKDNFHQNLKRNFQASKVDSVKLSTNPQKYSNVLSLFESTQHPRIVEAALNMARSTRSYAHSAKDDVTAREGRVNRYWIEVHRKFTLSIACLILFFIGAPLGAIIRKGGLGLPTVFSIVFFLIYYLLSITGEKFAKEGLWTVFEGMWLSSFVLLPVGLFLTYNATTDSKMFEWESYIRPFKRAFEILVPKKRKREDSSGLS